MSREQTDTLHRLRLKTYTFKQKAEDIWWHAANGYGKADRVGRLTNLRGSAEELIKMIDKAIEEQDRD